MNTVKEAMDLLSKEMQEDHSYAWSWHCNIAMASQDEGMCHTKANRAAAHFMYIAFQIDTSSFEEYKTLLTCDAE